MTRRSDDRTTTPGVVQPATARFRTGRNALSEPLYRASEPSDYALEPNFAFGRHRIPSMFVPRLSPSEGRRRPAKYGYEQGFSMIRETGLEPATARPPAGAIQAHRLLLGGLKRYDPGLHLVASERPGSRNDEPAPVRLRSMRLVLPSMPPSSHAEERRRSLAGQPQTVDHADRGVRVAWLKVVSSSEEPPGGAAADSRREGKPRIAAQSDAACEPRIA
jgi:hypothetical protein